MESITNMAEPTLPFGGRSKSMHKIGSLTNAQDLEKVKSVAKSLTCHENKPSPLYLDFFVPWACLQWEAGREIKIVKKRRDSYIPVKNPPKIGNTKSKTVRLPESCNVVESMSASMPKLEPVFEEDTFVLVTYYNEFDRLVEIDIVGCPYEIPREVLKAINLCLPFQKTLNKLTIGKGGVTDVVLYNIALGLPNSFITEVCLDDCNIKQGNYYVLLDKVSPLKQLSLCRCGINDVVVKELTTRLTMGSPASELLKILDLTSNNITDIGAQALGDMLRTNRQLLHLGLAGNSITNVGASSIFNVLMEFALNDQEIEQMKLRRWRYFNYKQVVYERCLLDQLSQNKKFIINQPVTKATTTMNAKSQKSKITSRTKSKLDIYDVAKMNAEKIAGERFIDIFDDDHITYRDGKLLALGNFNLCSLNLSYNNLDLFSLKKMVDVLRYQSLPTMAADAEATGLIRVLLYGNNTPADCLELGEIEMYLKNKIIRVLPVQNKKRFGKLSILA